jgi:hypothetical protein
VTLSRSAAGLLVVAAIVLAGLQALATSASEQGAPPARVADSPDLGTLVKRFLTPQGMLDPEFAKAIAKPSPYLSDFFGAQAIKDVTVSEVKRDFVPKHASVVKEGDRTIELTFTGGWTARFVTPSSLTVMGNTSNVSHVYISGDTWQALRDNLRSFRAILDAGRLTTRYLVPNPLFKEEEAVDAHATRAKAPVDLVFDPDATAFAKARDAVMIFPDAVHGDEQGFAEFLAFVKAHKVDWLGLEAMTPAQQKDLDTYVAAPETSPEFIAASKRLSDFLAAGWDKRFKDTAESHFMKVLAVMRANKSRVYGLESASLDYILWRYGETPFGGAVRSHLWARAAPIEGRGLIFGGSAHFASTTPWNVEDFLAARNPARPIFMAKKMGRYRQP